MTGTPNRLKPLFVDSTAWDRWIDKLHAMRLLRDDWDGEGSVAPTLALVEAAIKLAIALRGDGIPSPDRVAASVNGTVYLEWFTPGGYEEIEITSPVEAERRFVATGSDHTDVSPVPIP